MRLERFPDGADAERIRALSAPGDAVEEEVRATLEEVRTGGDAALVRLTKRFDAVDVPADALRVPGRELEEALDELAPGVADALGTARANVSRLAEALVREDVALELDEGQRIEVTEVPVRRVGIYVPGGRAPYPSTVVMAAETARAAGVGEVAVCAPPGPGGRSHPVILAACALCGVDEVYRVGGAQAVAAMTFGTETVPPVDVIVGPGNAWVQEAKRQAAGRVGIDSLAGPSEIVVVAAADADPELVALDLLAQAEHGADSLLVLIAAEEGILEAVEAEVERLVGTENARSTVADAPLALVRVRDLPAAVELADAIAPEHLELVGRAAEACADQVRSAGCLFVGRDAGTAFGDYVAGSNHVLPTGGAARFQSALGVGTFRRRMARVSLPQGAAARLAPAGAALAEAEGFPVHGESMTRRA
jgi:histidinol dehydrogenase